MADLGTIAALKAAVDLLLVDNNTGDITPDEHNALEKDIIDTIYAALESGDAATIATITAALENYAPINALGILYLFDTATTASDPGSAMLRYNNATFGSITEIYFNKVSQNGLDLSSFYDQQGPGLLTLKEVQGAQLSTFRVTAITDSGDYYTLTVIPLVGSIYSAGLQIVLEFDRNDGASSAVQQFTALLSQTGTDAPVLTIVTNGLSGTPSTSYVGAGDYRITLVGAFPADKTAPRLSPNSYKDGSDTYGLVIYRIDDDTLGLRTYDGAGALADGIITFFDGNNVVLDITVHENTTIHP